MKYQYVCDLSQTSFINHIFLIHSSHNNDMQCHHFRPSLYHKRIGIQAMKSFMLFVDPWDGFCISDINRFRANFKISAHHILYFRIPVELNIQKLWNLSPTLLLSRMMHRSDEVKNRRLRNKRKMIAIESHWN